MNKEQMEAWELSVMKGSFLSQIQGPPEAGKPFLDPAICLGWVLLDYKVAMTTPTNDACAQLAENATLEIEVLEDSCRNQYGQ